MYETYGEAHTDLELCGKVEQEARQDFWFGSKIPQAVVQYPHHRAKGTPRYARMPKDQAYRMQRRGKLGGEIVYTIG
jgi:hypothetical protein